MQNKHSKKEILSMIGLSSEEADIYLELQAGPAKSVLDISRSLKLPRTTVYRVLDILTEKELVRTKLDSRGSKFEANSAEKFNIIVEEQCAKMKRIKKLIPQLVTSISDNTNVKGDDNGRTYYFKGAHGLEQLMFNAINSGESIQWFYTYPRLVDLLNPKIVEYATMKFVKNNNCKIQLLTNHKDLPDQGYFNLIPKERREFRYVNQKMFDIKSDMIIYGNIYAMYNLDKKELFGLEIHNENFAQSQQSIFNIIWQKVAKTF